MRPARGLAAIAETVETGDRKTLGEDDDRRLVSCRSEGITKGEAFLEWRRRRHGGKWRWGKGKKLAASSRCLRVGEVQRSTSTVLVLTDV